MMEEKLKRIFDEMKSKMVRTILIVTALLTIRQVLARECILPIRGENRGPIQNPLSLLLHQIFFCMSGTFFL